MHIVRLARNHPLPDGNKHAAWVALRMFIEMNDWSWSTCEFVDLLRRLASGRSRTDPDEAVTEPVQTVDILARSSSKLPNYAGIVIPLRVWE